MVLIKVQYDAYNRQFRLLDRELAGRLEDGETYVLVADLSVEDLKVAPETSTSLNAEEVLV